MLEGALTYIFTELSQVRESKRSGTRGTAITPEE